MAIEVFPPELLFKDKWDEVVIFLQKIPIPPRRKKEVIVEWANYVGAVLTRDMIEQVLGLDAENV
jgi:predicted ATP-grasp superfamily ATP-dependent carboligase